MKVTIFRTFLAGAAMAVSGTMIHADQVFNDDVIMTDNLLCVGTSCTNMEPEIPSREGIKLKSSRNAIFFVDTSPGPNSDTEWQITVNDTNEDSFKIEDVTAGTTPVFVSAGAPDNALFVQPDGDIGLGTSLPATDIHIVEDLSPSIRFEETLFLGQIWDLRLDGVGFRLLDQTASSVPVVIESGAPFYSLAINPGGRVGLGTNLPEGKLHTKGDGVQLTYFESGDGGPVQVRFRTDSENRRFLAVNNANEVKSQLIFLDDRINFTGETDSGANLWLSVGPDGIISQGPTCSSPCDLTFDPDVFTVPAIDTRAAQMWQDMHLPGIGPTSPDEPMNLTEKMGGVIHELEVAHIYIEELHARLEAQELQAAAQQLELVAQAELNAQLLARLEALEGN